MSLLHLTNNGGSRVRTAGRKVVSTASTLTSRMRPSRPEHHPRTDNRSPALSPPLVTLFVSPSEPRQSEEAFEILAGSRTAFRVEESPDGTVFVRFAGKNQHRIEGVRNLSEALLEFHRILLDPAGDETFAAELERRHDPALGERARAELAEYTRAARANLERMIGEQAGRTL